MPKRSVKSAPKTVASKVVRSVRRRDEAEISRMPVAKLRKELARHVRMDGWISALTGAGTVRDKKEYAHFVAASTNWRENLDLWRGDGLAGRIVELPPDEMTREGYDIVVEEEGHEDEVKAVVSMLSDLQFDPKIYQGLCLERAVGGAGTVLGTMDLAEDMSAPLDLESVSAFKWCETFEPLELQVARWQNDPESPTGNFGRPEMFRLQPVSPGGVKRGSSTEIHASRVLMFPGIVVSRRQITSQMGWGDAVLTRCRSTIRDYQTSWGSIGHLIAEYGLAVWKIKNLAEIISMDKDEELKTRIEMMQMAMSMVNAAVIDGELEDYDRKQVPLTGLSDVLREMGARLSADSGIPMTKLFGMSPGGMNATGEYDQGSWYDHVGSQQDKKLRPHIEKGVKVALRALDIPEWPSWHVAFRPLKKETEGEKTTNRFTQSQTDEKYEGMGVLSRDEIRTARFGGRTFGYATHVKGPAPTPPAAPGLVAPGPASPDAAVVSPTDVKQIVAESGPRTSLTGVQITSMMAIVQSAARGELARPSAKALLTTSFPINDAQAEALLGAATP